MEITSLDKTNVFNVNGQRLKAYLEEEQHNNFSIDLL